MRVGSLAIGTLVVVSSVMLTGCATAAHCYSDPNITYPVRDQSGNVVRIVPMCLNGPPQADSAPTASQKGTE